MLLLVLLCVCCRQQLLGQQHTEALDHLCMGQGTLAGAVCVCVWGGGAGKQDGTYAEYEGTRSRHLYEHPFHTGIRRMCALWEHLSYATTSRQMLHGLWRYKGAWHSMAGWSCMLLPDRLVQTRQAMAATHMSS